jgi:hypothetical protein
MRSGFTTSKTSTSRGFHAFVRGIEKRRRPEADVEATISHERAISRALGGRTVFDDKKTRKGQLDLF